MKNCKNLITLTLTLIMLCACMVPAFAADLPKFDFPVIPYNGIVTRSPGGGYTEGSQDYYGKTMTATLDVNKVSGKATTSYPSTTREKEVSLSVEYVNLNTGETYFNNLKDYTRTSTTKTTVPVTWTRPSSAYEAEFYMSGHQVRNDQAIPGISLWLYV